MKKLILTTLLLSTASSAFAHDSVIRAGHLLDVKSGTYSTDQYILIEDGKISDVGNWDRLEIEGEYIDLSDKYIFLRPSGIWVLPVMQISPFAMRLMMVTSWVLGF